MGVVLCFISNVQRFINDRCEHYEDLPPRLHILRYNSITRRDTFENVRSLCTSAGVACLQSMAFRAETICREQLLDRMNQVSPYKCTIEW